MPSLPIVRTARRRIVTRAWWVFCLFVLVLLASAWLARGPLFGPTVARLISTMLEQETGGQALVTHATGGWLGDAQLSGVQVSSSVSKPWWLLRAEAVSVVYDFALLRGDIAAVTGVTVEGLSVVVDLDAQPSASSGVPQWPTIFSQVPEQLPDISVHGTAKIISEGHHVRLDGMVLMGGGDRLTITSQRLVADEHQLTIPEVEFVRSSRESFQLTQPLELALPGILPNGQSVYCDHLFLQLGDAGQRIDANGRLAGGTWQAAVTASSLSVSVRGVDLVALGIAPAALGVVVVDADIERKADGWLIKSVRAVMPGIQLAGRMTVASNPWRCTELQMNLTGDLAYLQLLVPAAKGVEGFVKATLRGDLQLSREHWSHGRLTLDLQSDDVSILGQVGAPVIIGVEIDQGRIAITELNGGWKTLQATLLPPAAQMDLSKPIPVPFYDEGWTLVSPPIAFGGGYLSITARGGEGAELDVELELIELQLSEFIQFSGLRYLQGTVSGRLQVGGNFQDPQWTGELTIENGAAKLHADIPTCTSGSVHCTLAARVVTLMNFQCDIGGSVLTAQGRILLDGGDNALALTCHGRNLLLVQRHDARVRADLDLRLKGSFKAPVLLGEVTVTSALLTPELHLNGGVAADVPQLAEADDRVVLFEFPDPPLSRVRFDVHIGSVTTSSIGPKLPTSSDTGLRIVTRWGRGLCDVDLHLGGTGAAPAPQGRLSVREGVATLPFSTLAITHGELLFPPTDPFQPLITATAKARIRRYDVQVQVTGTVHNPIIRASGSGLDEQEALMLLTTGSTPRELQDETGRMAALGRLGGWLGQETWRTIEGADDPEAGPSVTDRLSIEWGRESSAQGRDTIDAEVELTNPGSRPAVLMTGERDRYEQYNGGFTLRWYWGGEDP